MTGPADRPADPPPDDDIDAGASAGEPRTPAPLRPAAGPPEGEPFPGDAAGMGDLLRRTRVRRGMSLAEAADATRINRAYLEAIEAGRLELLPAPVYARGFVRSYARSLGLDDAAAVAAVPGDLPRPAGLEPLRALRHTEPRVLPRVDGRLLAAVAAVLLLLALAFIGVRWLGGDGSDGDAGGGAPDEAALGPAAGPGPAGPLPAVAPTAGLAVASSEVPAFEPGTAPNFIGVDRATAEALLRELDRPFVVIEARDERAPAGQVFAQSPDPGAPLEAGDTVTLIVSRGAGTE